MPPWRLGGGGRIEVASGHYGHLHPDFLAQMCRTLRSVEDADAAEDEWDDVGRLFLYHSSRETVLALASDRAIRRVIRSENQTKGAMARVSQRMTCPMPGARTCQ